MVKKRKNGNCDKAWSQSVGATEAERYWAGEPTTTDYEFARIRLAAANYCHDELRASSGPSQFRLKEFKARRKERRKRRQKQRRATVKFEAAIRGLPATAPDEAIMDWIGGHPAMGWHIRMEEEEIIGMYLTHPFEPARA